MNKKVISYIKLLRPKQWTKNALVFAGLVFSKNLFDLEYFIQTLIGFFLFCLISSCVYILNDSVDKEKDKLHPKKCKRPIASGEISIPQAILLFVILFLISIVCGFSLNLYFGVTMLVYFMINMAYSFYLKTVPIVDMMCIAIGFVLRALAGGFLIDNTISPWLFVCTLLLALFLAIQKRKSELQAVADGKTVGRTVLKHYSQAMLRDMSSAIDSATIMAYCLYTFNNEKVMILMCTIPFVIYGLFRYQMIVHSSDLAETPEMALLKDKPLLVDILLWGMVCLSALYL